MVAVVRWTGREAKVLREIALRMSVRDFAAHTHLSTFSISDMEAKGERAQLRLSTQKILDNVLAAVSEDARQRFCVVLGPAVFRAAGAVTAAGAVAAGVGVDGLAPGPPSGARVSDAHSFLLSAAEQRELVDRASDESLRSAVHAWSQQVPGMAIEQMWLKVRVLARAYAATSPIESLSRARRVRDFGLELGDRTRRPRQLEELYLGIGHACAVMAIASFDLRAFEAAVQQAAAAHTFAEMTGHSGLCSWALGLQAQIAFWRGRPADAVRLASQGVAVAPDGTARARMLCILARARSHLGDGDQTRRMLADAQRVRDSLGEAGNDELHDEIGGPFGWGPARQAACASNALLRVGDADAAAEQARLAIALHDADGTGTLVDTRAWADIAAAELARGELDAAQDALRPVWLIPPALRRYGLLGRLEDIATALTKFRYRDSAVAGELHEQISGFADQAPRALTAGVS